MKGEPSAKVIENTVLSIEIIVGSIFSKSGNSIGIT